MQNVFTNNLFVPFTGYKRINPALNVAVSRSVKKIFIFAFLLFSVDSFALTSIEGCTVYESASGSSCTAAQVADGTCTFGSFGQTGYDLGQVNGTTAVYSQSFQPLYMDPTYYWFRWVNGVSCPDCSAGMIRNPSTFVCETPLLSSFDNDASGCSKAGGTFMSVGTEQVGGTYYGASFFGGQGIMLGGDIHAVTKCGTTADVVGEVVSTALNLMPLVSSLFKNSAVKKMANTAVLDKLQELPYFGGGNNMPDYNVGLPKLPSPSDIAGGNSSPHVPVTSSDVPTVVTPDGNLPSRAPQINSDSNYANISDVFVPTKTNGDALIDYSIVDRFNTFNKIPDTGIPMSQIVPNVGSSSLPVKETFDFSNIIQNSTIPSDIATVPTVTTKSTTYSNTDLVEVYTTTKTYPDNSSSNQVLTLNTVSKVGEIKTTTLSPTGETSTVYKPIIVPDYNQYSTIDQWTVQNAPNITATTNDGGATSTAPTTSPITNPDVVNNQSATDIINANMPTYSLQNTPEFVLFDSNPISDLINDTSQMFSNISDQLASTKTVFDNTLTMLQGGWSPPVIPEGSCGDSLAFDFHGRHVDLCPPLVNETQRVSPLVSSVVTIGGMAFAVVIFIGGF